MVEYGIQEIRLMAANTDGSMPDFDSTDAKVVRLIVIDSFQEDQENDQEVNLYEEGVKYPVSTFISQFGQKTITFQTYDLSQDQLAYLLGYTFENGYIVENPGYILPRQAMQLITKPIGAYPAKVREWSRLNVMVKKTGTTGKNGLPYLQLDMKTLANSEMSGYRERIVTSSYLTITPTHVWLMPPLNSADIEVISNVEWTIV